MRKHALAVLAVLFLAACAGIKARENAQMPVMLLAYTQVLAPSMARGVLSLPAEQQVAATAGIAAFGAALDSGDRQQVRELISMWHGGLRPLFEAGLSARVLAEELGPNGANVLRETLIRFDANLVLLLSR